MTFLMKYGEQWFRRQNVRKNLGSRVMRRLGSNDHKRIRIQQDLNCLQVRDSSRLLLDDILKTKLARIGQNLVHAVSVGGISGANEVDANILEKLGTMLPQLLNALEKSAKHVAHLGTA